MKKLLSLTVALMLVFAMTLSTFASVKGRTYSQNGIEVVETASISYQDLKRLEDVINGNDAIGLAGEHKNSGAHIVNAQAINSAGTEWVIRIAGNEGSNEHYNGDFYVSCKPYYWDINGLQVLNAPDKEKDTPTYGPCWYYCGLFESGGNHNITGFAVAQRIKRWPSWSDLTYTGRKWNPQADVLNVTRIPTGEVVTGHYNQPCSNTFLADHGVK